MANNEHDEKTKLAFAGNTTEVELSVEDKGTRGNVSNEGPEMETSGNEEEMASTQPQTGGAQEAGNSRTGAPKKKLSGAQRKRQNRERKIAAGTWVQKPRGSAKRQPIRMDQGAAGKSAKRDRPGGESYREALTAVKMAVLLEGHPDNKLTEEQAGDLELQITNKIGTRAEFAPTFLSCKLENGALLISCADLESSKWLEQAVSEINPDFENKLLVGEARKLVRTTKILVKLPKVFSKLEPKEALKKIEAQNGGLTSTEWAIVHLKNDDSGQTMVLNVPELDSATLCRRGYKFYIGLHQVQAKVLEKSTKSTDGSEDSSGQHPPQ